MSVLYSVLVVGPQYYTSAYIVRVRREKRNVGTFLFVIPLLAINRLCSHGDENSGLGTASRECGLHHLLGIRAITSFVKHHTHISDLSNLQISFVYLIAVDGNFCHLHKVN